MTDEFGENRHLTDGERAIVARLREGLVRIKAMPCPDCRGSGDGRWQDDYCLRCGGSGVMVPLEEPTVCTLCEGRGWYTDHEEACFRAGQCVGCGGVQVRCDKCVADDSGRNDPPTQETT